MDRGGPIQRQRFRLVPQADGRLAHSGYAHLRSHERINPARRDRVNSDEEVRLIQNAINANSITENRITVPTYGYGIPQNTYETDHLRSRVDEQRYQLLQVQSQLSAVQEQLLREVQARKELEKVVASLVENLYGDIDNDQ